MFNLSKISLFSGLSDADLKVITPLMQTITLPEGHLIVQEGEISSNLYIIKSGQVEVFIRSDSGNKYVLRNLSHGSYFGELAFLENSQRTASVITTLESKLFEIKKDDFNEILKRYPSVNTVMLKNLVGLVRTLSEEVKELASKNVYPSLKKYLLDRDMQGYEKRKTRDALTPEIIAQQINCPADIIAYLLSHLENNHYIDIDGDTVYIYKTLPEQILDQT